MEGERSFSTYAMRASAPASGQSGQPSYTGTLNELERGERSLFTDGLDFFPASLYVYVCKTRVRK